MHPRWMGCAVALVRRTSLPLIVRRTSLALMQSLAEFTGDAEGSHQTELWDKQLEEANWTLAQAGGALRPLAVRVAQVGAAAATGQMIFTGMDRKEMRALMRIAGAGDGGSGMGEQFPSLSDTLQDSELMVSGGLDSLRDSELMVSGRSVHQGSR